MARSILALVMAALLLMGFGNGASDDTQRVVSASEIMAKIENGEPVDYDGVIVEGDLSLSDVDLPTMYIDRTEIEIGILGLAEETCQVNTSINIKNSEIRGVVNFSNATFLESVNFERNNFSDYADFTGSQFSSNAVFLRAYFNDYANFEDTRFRNDADFSGIQFNGDSSFRGAKFSSNVDFTGDRFSNDADFWRVKFGRYVIFWKTQFNGDVCFQEAQFDGDAVFVGVQFNGDTGFFMAKFNGDSGFYTAKFNGNADFTGIQFNDYADFREAKFSDDADFTASQFNNYADFSRAKFENDSNFNEVKFSDNRNFDTNFEETSFGGSINFEDVQFSQYADFRDAHFNNDIDLTHARFERLELRWDPIDGKLICDETAYMALIKNYENLAWFDDADECLYAYGNWRRENIEFGLSKIYDYAAFAFCGYGVKPLRPIGLGLFIIIACAIYYRWANAIRRHEKERDHQEPNIWDALYFSMMTFTTVGYGDWYPLDKHRIVATVEGLVGWLTLSLFLVTLANVVIR